MNVIIMTDLEGVSGVDSFEMIQKKENPEGYRFACSRLMTDLNAAVDGCLDAGAENIWVMDYHGGGGNFIKEMLHPRACQITMNEWAEMSKAHTYDAYMEVGCHSMAGTLNGFLDHTRTSKSWFSFEINGRPFGEIGLGAVFCGAYDIPMVMVSGDAAACQEARSFLGDISTACVKYGIGRNNARLEPQEKAVEYIRSAAAEGIRRADRIRPLKIPLPFEVKLTLYRTDMADRVMQQCSDAERLDARTVRRMITKLDHYTDMFFDK